jgi:DNA-binding MurR/RpiR family transcriptional regulator
MSLTVRLPEELARRVAEIAAQRHQSPEQVALEAIEAQVPASRRLSFSGIGSSGSVGGDMARRHREIVAEDFSQKTARDV